MFDFGFQLEGVEWVGASMVEKVGAINDPDDLRLIIIATGSPLSVFPLRQQPGIGPFWIGVQFLMATPLHHMPLLQDKNQICVPHRAQPVRHDDLGAGATA